MEIGKRAKKKRKALGLTLRQMAEKVGISAATLNRFEAWTMNPHAKTLAAIKAALGLRGGVKVGRPKKAKTPRKTPKDDIGPLFEAYDLATAINRLAASLEALALEPTSSLPLVPPVAEQRRATEAMTQGIARNGLRRPLASNSPGPGSAVRGPAAGDPMKSLLYALCWLWGRVDRYFLDRARHQEARRVLQAKVYPFKRRQG